MKFIARTASIAALTLGVAATANAGYIPYFTSGQTTTVAGATVVDFEGGPVKPANYTGAGSVVNYSVSGGTAAPAGDTSWYYTVAYPYQSGVGTFTANAGESYNYFGLYWGSIDSYNTLNFYSNGTQIASVTGTDVIAAGANLGDQTSAGSNRYVNFLFDTTFDRIDFITTNFAFETDNHAFANVSAPEPATLGLFAIGLLGAGAARRRRQKQG